jgi:hypothetical protein
MKAALWAVAFSRLLGRRLIQPLNPRDLNTRIARPGFIPSIRSVSNARHHPPRSPVDLHDIRRVRGRVHAVVRRGVSIDKRSHIYG